MLTIISSAKTLDFTGSASALSTSPQFLKKTKALVSELQRKNAKQLALLLGVSSKLGDLNFDRFQKFDLKSARAGKPALQVYRGDVYQCLDAESLTAKDLKFAQEHLAILSGLYGLLRPLDNIQEYRLEMSTRLALAGAKDLYQYWQPEVTATAAKSLALSRSPVLVNLASEEYSKCINRKQLGFEMIDVYFKQRSGATLKNVGLFAKLARGYMARLIIKQQIDRPEGLKEFDCEGYSYDNKLSSEETFVFTRKWK